jgi:hypothetical protein
MVNRWFTTFAFAVPLLQSARLREKYHGRPMEGRVGQSEIRRLVSWYNLPTTSQLARGRSPVKLHSHAHVSCARDHRCTFRSVMADARPHLSVEFADLRRHCSALPCPLAMVMQTMAHVNLEGPWWPHLARSCSCWLLAMPWASCSCSCEVVLIRGPCTFWFRQFGYKSINFVNGLLLGSRTAMHVRPPTDNQPTSTLPCPPFPRSIPLRCGSTGLIMCFAEGSNVSI